jgi:hypothetical protein
MRRLLTPALVLAISLTAASGRTPTGSQNPPPPQRPPSGPVPADQGRVEGGVYSNDFFGFSFKLPAGWVVQDAAAKKAMMEKWVAEGGEEARARRKAEMEEAMSRNFLLSASKYDLNSPPPDFHAIIMCSAERVATAVVKTEADYLAASLDVLRGAVEKLELKQPIHTERVGGATFGMMEFQMTNHGRVGVVRQYTKLLKGYALTITYTYADQADLKTFEEVIGSLRFK